MTGSPERAGLPDPGDPDAQVPPDEVRHALRDLLPGYAGPPDPLLRVGASIRRRRSRRRALLAVGSAATAAAMVAAVPTVLTSLLPGPVGGARPPGAPPDRSVPPVPAPSGPTGSPAAPPPVHLVANGTTAGIAWEVGSTSPGGAAQRCLYSDGAIFARDTVCFDAWRPGDPLSWHVEVLRSGQVQVTRLVGVAPEPAETAYVRLEAHPAISVAAVSTATDPQARFFAIVLAGRVAVASVTARDGDGRPLGAAVTSPVEPGCVPAPDNACAEPSPPR